MNILSLFDGISCAFLALEKANIKIDNYYASEIEPNAIKVAKKNHPNIVSLGDVTKVHYENGILYTETSKYEVGKIDIVCGGSPCTNFSSIGYANGMVSGDTEILSLSQYLDLKNKVLLLTVNRICFGNFVES